MAQVFSIESVIVDTGIIYALADRKDKWHVLSVDFIKTYGGRLIVPSTVIPEVCYLLNAYLGQSAEVAFIHALVKREFAIEHFSHDDLKRCLEILSDYTEADIGLVDASLVATAERLRISRIVTTDRKHFSMIKPKHCAVFELLP